MIKFDIAVCGGIHVGKSSLCNMITTGKPGRETTTLVMDLKVKKYKDGTSLFFWDFGGEERYYNVITSHVKKVALILLVYNMAERTSICQAIKLYFKTRDNTNARYILVGTHLDCAESQLNIETSIFGMEHLEISSKTGEGFDKLEKKILEVLFMPILRTISLDKDDTPEDSDVENILEEFEEGEKRDCPRSYCDIL